MLLPRGGERFRIVAIEPMMGAEAPVPRDVDLASRSLSSFRPVALPVLSTDESNPTRSAMSMGATHSRV